MQSVGQNERLLNEFIFTMWTKKDRKKIYHSFLITIIITDKDESKRSCEIEQN